MDAWEIIIERYDKSRSSLEILAACWWTTEARGRYMVCCVATGDRLRTFFKSLLYRKFILHNNSLSLIHNKWYSLHHFYQWATKQRSSWSVSTGPGHTVPGQRLISPMLSKLSLLKADLKSKRLFECRWNSFALPPPPLFIPIVHNPKCVSLSQAMEI